VKFYVPPLLLRTPEFASANEGGHLSVLLSFHDSFPERQQSYANFAIQQRISAHRILKICALLDFSWNYE
jgi:hypothetical protein